MLTKNWARGATIGVLMLAASLLYAPGAHAQAVGSTDVDVSMQGVVILHYFSNIDLTFQTSDLEAFLGFGGDTNDEGTRAGTGFSPDMNMAAVIDAPTNDPAAAVLTMQNAWAVRAIASAGATSVTVAIALTDTTLVHSVDVTKSIVLSSPLVSEDGATFAASRQFAAPGLINPEYGDVRLTLDMTTAIISGDYLDGAYQITVTIT